MSRRRTFPLSALSDGQRAAVEEQLGRPIGRGERMKPEALEAALGPSVAAKVRGPYRSKAEADYAAFLASLPGVTWRYERLSIGLPGKGTRYKPDFTRTLPPVENLSYLDGRRPCHCSDCDGTWCVWCLDHHGKKPCPFEEAVKAEVVHVLPGGLDRCAVEVKGTKEGRPYWRTHGHRRRALDGAAELWEALRIPLFVAWKVDGAWEHERLPVREG